MLASSVYVHFPWCLQKCPYCDFATKPLAWKDVPSREYADAVVAELEQRRGEVEGRELVSVFFGGGTPSLWDPSDVGRVLRAIEDAFGVSSSGREVTIECNPSSLDSDRAKAFVDAGINRMSIGVQSLDDAQLKFLGRLHNAARAREAVSSVVKVVPRVSADVMFGTPGRNAEEFVRDVRELTELGVKHLSAYALTIEPGTRFAELKEKGRLPLATDDGFADTYLAVESELATLGFEHYEVSNYAQGRDEESLHNAHYWRGGAYFGVGAAAVGCMDRDAVFTRSTNARDPGEYMKLARDRKTTAQVVETLAPAELARETWMLGLRTRYGVDAAQTAARIGIDPRSGNERALSRLLERGDLVTDDANLYRVPSHRWLALDSIVCALF